MSETAVGSRQSAVGDVAIFERRMAEVDRVLAFVRAEIERAMRKHGPMASAHEGYAVILEEVDELWADIKADRGTTEAAMREAIQIAAMGIRYVADLGGEGGGHGA